MKLWTDRFKPHKPFLQAIKEINAMRWLVKGEMNDTGDTWDRVFETKEKAERYIKANKSNAHIATLELIDRKEAKDDSKQD